MHCDVRQEAGWRHFETGPRLKAIAEAVAPVVESVTGLVLPGQTVIRLVKTGAWHGAICAHAERLFADEVRQLLPEPAELRAARDEMEVQHRHARSSWLGNPAQMIIAVGGAPEILMAPDGLFHAGRLLDDRYLHHVLAHELCHAAQHRAGRRGHIMTLRMTPFPALRGVDGLALVELMEGHAEWAAKQVTTKVIGDEAQEAPKRRTSRRYRQYMARAGDNQATWSLYDQGERFVEQVMTRLSLESFNLLWRNPDLIPDADEIAAPDAWLDRVLPRLEEGA